ncbi:MAG: DinB family protein [Fimbriimonadales bacterium]|nr:DinB family protein [Fimbriimonadales bacterium]
MPFQQMVSKLTLNAVDELLRYAKAIPADKLTWRPAAHARSALEILQECAVLPAAVAAWLHERPQSPPSMEQYAPIWAQAQTLTTLDACEVALRENTQKLLQAVESLSEADLNQTAVAPWGRTYTLAEGCFIHYWNLTYHLGQIAYIQLLYGDTAYY